MRRSSRAGRWTRRSCCDAGEQTGRGWSHGACALDPSTRVPWYGPAMAARSFVTARLMETWAHGQDVADALGVTAPPTARLRHVAHIGVRARPFSYAVHRWRCPTADVHVELTRPDGEVWDVG